MGKRYEIVVFAGDNCGPEVIDEALKVLSFYAILH